eukprot:scaffold291727_cov33-Tisochrysis_lutea.AAC.1
MTIPDRIEWPRYATPGGAAMPCLLSVLAPHADIVAVVGRVSPGSWKKYEHGPESWYLRPITSRLVQLPAAPLMVHHARARGEDYWVCGLCMRRCA